MHRNRIVDILDQLRHEIENLQSENQSLKLHVKELEDKTSFHLQELKKTQTYIKELNSFIKSMRKVPLEVNEPQVRKLKVGSDWFMEGDPLMNISLARKFSMFGAKCIISSDTKYIGLVNKKNCYIIYEREVLYINHAKDMFELARSKSADEGKADMCFSSDSAFVYTFHYDKIIRKWDMEERKLLKKINIKEDVIFMKCSSMSLIAICRDNVLRVFEEDKMKEITVAKGIINCMCVSDDRKLCYLGYTDRKLVVVDLMKDQMYSLHLNRSINCMCVSSDKSIIVVGSDEGVILYKINQEYMEIEGESGIKVKGKIVKVKLMLKDNYLVVAGTGDSIKIYDLKNNGCMALSCGEESLLDVEVSKNVVCTASIDGLFKIWNFNI